MIGRALLKRSLYPLLASLARLRRRRVPPAAADCHRVLVMQLGLVGDVLLATPLLAQLRATLPAGAHITVVVPPHARAVLEGNTDIDEIATYDALWADPADEHRHTPRWKHLVASWRFVRAHRAVQYDLAINCWVMDQPFSAALLSMIGARGTIGFDFPFSRAFYDAAVPFDAGSHLADALCALAPAGGLSANAGARRLRYTPPPEAPEPRDSAFRARLDSLEPPIIVVAPFSSERRKEWRLDHWATTLDALAQRYPAAQLVLTGVPDSRPRAAELLARVRSRILNAVGETSLAGFAALVERAALLVTTDSGAMHIASAVGTPTYVLFSQIYDYRQLTPYGVPGAYSVIDVPCAGCIYGCAAMTCMQHDPADVIVRVIQFGNGIPALEAVR
jgi:ADP-heptose:LPS heptosyltransferase